MSVNKVILIGNVGKDPEVRYLDNNVAVANFPLATTERGYTTRAGVQVPDRTEWHNIVLWRGLAETAEKYVRKGTQLYIEGRIRTRNYEVDGATRYITEIYLDNMEMLTPKGAGQGAGTSAQQGAATPSQQPQQMQQNQQPQQSQAQPVQDNPADDLPF